jgi:tetratricopeptide (TPR) repeat protein
MKRLLVVVSPLSSLWRAVRRRPGYAAASAILLLGVSLAVYHGLRQSRARTHRQCAVRALARWDFQQARADLAYCVEVWPGDFQTRYLAAHIARRAGFLDEAAEHLRQCRRLGAPDPRTALESALLRAQGGQVSEVEEYLLDLIRQDDLEAPLILEALALGYVHVYQLPKAGRCLDLLLQRQPRNVFALKWRGHCLEGIGVHEKAIEDYRKAIAIDPDYDEARMLLADRLATRLKRYAEAIEHFEILRRRQPDKPVIAVGLARCRRLLGEGDKARRLLDEVLRAHPNYLEALAERGHLALEDGKPAEAERYLRPAAALPSPDRQVLHSLYQALLQLGKEEEASAVLARGRRMDEDMKAMVEVLKEIGANPQDASLYCRAAAICLRNGQDGEAVRWLQGALTRDPRYGPAHAALADYYERKGAADLAAQHRQLAAPAAGAAAMSPNPGLPLP